AGADQVAGGDHHRVVGVGGLERRDVAGEVLGAAGVDALDAAARAGGRLEVAVEVVDAEDLHLDGWAGMVAAPSASPARQGGVAGSEGDRRQGGGRQSADAA